MLTTKQVFHITAAEAGQLDPRVAAELAGELVGQLRLNSDKKFCVDGFAEPIELPNHADVQTVGLYGDVEPEAETPDDLTRFAFSVTSTANKKSDVFAFQQEPIPAYTDARVETTLLFNADGSPLGFAPNALRTYNLSSQDDRNRGVLVHHPRLQRQQEGYDALVRPSAGAGLVLRRAFDYVAPEWGVLKLDGSDPGEVYDAVELAVHRRNSLALVGRALLVADGRPLN